MNKTMLNNIKTVAYEESISFLKDKALKVNEVLTTNHKKLLQQFQNYKKHTNFKLQEYEEFWAVELLKQREIAKDAPVKEAEYQIKRIKDIGLYDCLVPRLRVLKKPTKPKENESDSEWHTFEELV